jgi:hypothetical protein
MTISRCFSLVAIALHYRGRNPCRNEYNCLSEAIEVADCCCQQQRFDLASEMLDNIDAFELGRREPLSSQVKAIRDLIANANTRKPNEKQELPPIWIRGLNFAIAMANYAAIGFVRCTQEKIDGRLAICQDCSDFTGDHCSRCGCACVESNRLLNKLALESEHCPLGKW